MTDFQFDPESVNEVSHTIIQAMVDLLGEVERPLRNVSFPQMPAGVQGQVVSGLASAIAIMSTARVALADVANDLRRRTINVEDADKFTFDARSDSGGGNGGGAWGLAPEGDLAGQALSLLAIGLNLAGYRLDHAVAVAPAAVAEAQRALDAARQLPNRSASLIGALESRLALIVSNRAALAALGDALFVAGIPLSLYLNYSNSAATSAPLRLASSTASTALTTLFPPAAVLDLATGGGLTAAVDLPFAVLGGSDGLQAWSDANHDFSHGPQLWLAGQVGEFITPATTTVLNWYGGAENWPFSDEDGTVDWTGIAIRHPNLIPGLPIL